MNPLEDKPLRYLIGADKNLIGPGRENEIIEVPWDNNRVPSNGQAIGYCNLLDEQNKGHYPPYMHQSGTSEEYDEGLIDPHGHGFTANIADQIERRKEAGFKFVEWDNPDSYPLSAVMKAIAMSEQNNLGVIAKNPGLGCSDGPADQIMAHPNVFGVIIENGAGTPVSMVQYRLKVGRPTLPLWFVLFGNSTRIKSQTFGKQAKQFKNVGVTWCNAGEYGNSIDRQVPL